MEILIRRYETSDLEVCRALWSELTQRHREIYGDPMIGGDDPGHFFDAYLKNPNLRGPWVAELVGRAVGLGGLIVNGEEGEVEPLVVSSQHRSKGIGRALLNTIVQEAGTVGVRFLSVRPVARNIEAISFFVQAGFDTIGHIDLFQDLSGSAAREWKPGIEIHGHRLRY
jgi:GNAT superfamily N-acetyltransferase